MNHEVFWTSASRSHLTVERMAYLVFRSAQPPLFWLAPPLPRETASRVAAMAASLITSTLIGKALNLNAQVSGMCCLKVTQRRRRKKKTCTPKIKLYRLYVQMMCQAQQKLNDWCGGLFVK